MGLGLRAETAEWLRPFKLCLLKTKGHFINRTQEASETWQLFSQALRAQDYAQLGASILTGLDKTEENHQTGPKFHVSSAIEPFTSLKASAFWSSRITTDSIRKHYIHVWTKILIRLDTNTVQVFHTTAIHA